MQLIVLVSVLPRAARVQREKTLVCIGSLRRVCVGLPRSQSDVVDLGNLVEYHLGAPSGSLRAHTLAQVHAKINAEAVRDVSMCQKN